VLSALLLAAGGWALYAWKRCTRLKTRLLESESWRYRVFENVGEGVAVLNTRLEVQYLNPAARRMIKFGDPDHHPAYCHSLFFGLREPCENCPAQVAARTGGYCSTEKFFSDGTILTISATPLLDGSGKVEGFIEIFNDISDQKQLEQDLVEKEERHRITLDSISEAVITVDVKRWVTRMNSTAETITGFRIFEAVGKPLSAVLPLTDPATGRDLDDLCGIVLSTRQPRKESGHCRWKNPSGETLHLTRSAAPIFNREGKVQGIIIILQDVSDTVRRQEALQLSENRFRRLFEANPLGLALLARGNFIDMNSEFCRITGYPREELLGEPAAILFPDKHPSGKGGIRPFIPTSQRIIGQEALIAGKNNLPVPVEFSTSEYQAAQEERGVILSIQNISLRKRAEKRLDALFQSMPEIVLFCRMEYGPEGRPADYRILGVNRAFRNLPEFRETDCTDLLMSRLTGKNPPPFLDEAEEVLKKQATYQIPSWTDLFSKKLGVSLIPFSEDNFALIGTDNTGQAAIEKRLFQKRKMEAIGQLAGGIAHDFNNIMAGILGFAELLQQHLADQRPYDFYCSEIITASERAAGLTRQLLSYSRKQEMNAASLDMHALIEEWFRKLEKTFPEDVEVSFRFNAENAVISGDREQMREVLEQLGKNAFESLENGGAVSLHTENRILTQEDCREDRIEPGRYFALVLTDTGRGIDSSLQEKVFDPFFSTKEPGQGSGMGLAMVYGTIASHQGTIWMNSSPGRGTEITLLLPTQETLRRQQTWHGDSGARGNILLVDDDPLIRTAAEEVLKNMGYGVVTAETGESALEIYEARQEEIRAVILDLFLPGINGDEVFRRMKQRNPEIRAILATGFSQEERARNLRKEGLLGVIGKPYRQVDLESLLDITGNKEKGPESSAPPSGPA